MPRLPRVTGAEVVRALRRAGWAQVSQEGSHVQLRHNTRSGRVTVPIHKGETLGPKLLSSILAQADMTADELRALL
jgi:predicted RNA binding protein YcfA (HicA-like mRNA interferase family)